MMAYSFRLNKIIPEDPSAVIPRTYILISTGGLVALLSSYRAQKIVTAKKGREVLIEIFVKIEDLIQEIKKNYLTDSLIFYNRKPIFGNFDFLQLR